MTNDVQEVDEPEEQGEEGDSYYFWEYLHSEKGHEVVSRALKIVEDVKKGTLERSERHARFERWLQVAVTLVIVIASTVLTMYGKFDTSIGVLFGTLVGYLFGKRSA